MIKQMLQDAKDSLPFSIKNIIWDSPNLNIYGKDWAFFTMDSWRIIIREKMIIGSSDNDSEIKEILETTSKEKIINIDFQSKYLIADPVFLFSNDWLLEVFSSSSFEPWTLKIPSKNIVYVASPRDPECIDTV